MMISSLSQGEKPVEMHNTDTVLHAATHLSETMGIYRERVCPTFNCVRYGKGNGHDGILILSIFVTYGALIRLYGMSADKDILAYKRRLAAASACAVLAAEAAKTDPNLLHLTVYIPWCAAYEILAHEIIRLGTVGDAEGADAVQVNIDGLTVSLETFARRHTHTHMSKHCILQLRRFNIHPTGLDAL